LVSSILRLTRGLALHIESGPGGKWLRMGPGWRLDFAQIPVIMWVTLEGAPCKQTGMLVNVTEIKKVVADALAGEDVRAESSGEVLRWARGIFCDKFKEFKVLRVRLDLHEDLSLAWEDGEKEMMEITVKYELAASHKLVRDEWDDDKNFSVFGKCSNPAGHGHNYLIEISLRGKPDERTGQIVGRSKVDEVVKREILEQFDHKNLNEDTDEFAEKMATVENMSKVFWDKLIGNFGTAELTRVRVWETPRTYADYTGG